MRKRLQILLPGPEMEEIRTLARKARIPVSEWVRGAIRAALANQPVNDPQAKLRALHKAVEYSCPTADIGAMLSEIEQGYRT